MCKEAPHVSLPIVNGEYTIWYVFMSWKQFGIVQHQYTVSSILGTTTSKLLAITLANISIVYENVKQIEDGKDTANQKII